MAAEQTGTNALLSETAVQELLAQTTNLEGVKQVLFTLHNPALTKEHSVTKLWEDLEETYEKGGDVYGMRNLHPISFALLHGKNVWSVEGFPGRNDKHGYVVCTSGHAHQVLNRARAILAETQSE